jgi:hypothetical protein
MFSSHSSPGPWLGQVPLVLGPSSWGAGVPLVGLAIPPYYGEWGVVSPDGVILNSGRVGPYSTVNEAFAAAAAAAVKHGATALPTDGFAQVKDSQGNLVGPVT